MEFISDITETKRFLTEIMRDENADMKDRLKASEYIAKTKGAFFEKKELQGTFNNKIKFGFVDPTLAEDLCKNMLMTIILVQYFNMNTEYYTHVKYTFTKNIKK